MANKPISMSKVRQILKFYAQGIGKQKIAGRLGMSKNTVREYIDRFKALKSTITEVLKLPDDELDALFRPYQAPPPSTRLEQLTDFFPEAQRMLRKRGVTLSRVFAAYYIKHPDGFKRTQFYKYYREWSRRIKCSMPIDHKAGDKMYIDYAGAKWPYVDEHTGEIRQAEIYVAILGWSQYAYVEATEGQSLGEFIGATERALHFFKGVPLAVVPDNLKSAVFKSNRYEPELNENFNAFADHYGMAVIPARVRKPQDKAHVENLVKIAYRKIYADLPSEKTLTLGELNGLIRQHLEGLNEAMLSGRDCSRKDQWMLELPFLQDLAELPYEMREIRQVTVMKNAHVYLREDKHYYSVPYQLVGKKLKMHYSKSTVDLYLNYQLVASHERLKRQHGYTTEPSHMPLEHQYVMQWSKSFFVEQGNKIDPVVGDYLKRLIEGKRHPEQGYKSCQGILALARKVGQERLIKACRRADDIGYYNYKIIEDILRKNLDRMEEDLATEKQMPPHDNIRGPEYFTLN